MYYIINNRKFYLIIIIERETIMPRFMSKRFKCFIDRFNHFQDIPYWAQLAYFQVIKTTVKYM